MANIPPPPPPIDPNEVARRQRERVLKAGKPVTGDDVAKGLTMGSRIGCFLLLLLLSLVVTVFIWPLGLLMLFLLVLMAFVAR